MFCYYPILCIGKWNFNLVCCDVMFCRIMDINAFHQMKCQRRSLFLLQDQTSKILSRTTKVRWKVILALPSQNNNISLKSILLNNILNIFCFTNPIFLIHYYQHYMVVLEMFLALINFHYFVACETWVRKM